MKAINPSVPKEAEDILTHVEHIGIAVENLDEAGRLYQDMLGVPCYKTESVASEGVITAFYLVGKTKIELLAPTDENSPIRKYLDKRGPGVHHIAFAVNDIRGAMDRLSRAGFRLISEVPSRGADNKLVCFVHPRSTAGTLIELCQEIHGK